MVRTILVDLAERVKVPASALAPLKCPPLPQCATMPARVLPVFLHEVHAVSRDKSMRDLNLLGDPACKTTLSVAPGVQSPASSVSIATGGGTMFFDKFVVPNPGPHAYLLFSEARRLSISSSYEMIYI